jgi:diacylglycerol kinase (ATP)
VRTNQLGTAALPGAAAIPTRAALVVNRQARLAAAGPWEAAVMQVLAQRFAVEAVHPGSLAEMIATVRARLATGDTLVVIAGGDGSLNAALRAGTPGPLAVLPLGTANDLSRALQLPLDPVAAALRLVQAQPRAWDQLTVNGHPFCTVGGFGTAADVALGVKRMRDRPGLGATAARWLGPHIYHLAAAEIIAARPFVLTTVDMTIVPPGGGAPIHVRARTPALLVANQPTLAGVLRVSPQSRPDDGVFEICLFRASTRAGLLATLVRLLAGGPNPDIEVFAASAARLCTDTPRAFFGDGELLVETGELDLAVTPGALTLYG